jgi:hypothetical protein
MPGYLRPHIQTIFPGPTDPKYTPEQNASGKAGFYWVEFTFLPQPLLYHDSEGQDLRSDFVGDSHLIISEPLPTDVKHKHIFTVNATVHSASYFMYCNNHGRLSHVNFRAFAQDFDQATQAAKDDLNPFLSGWAARFNVPLYVFRIRVLEEATNVVRNIIYHQVYPLVRIMLDNMNQAYWFPNDIRIFDFYREALNTTSPKYQFLCYYKVIELVLSLRAARVAEARKKGAVPAQYRDLLGEEAWFMPHLSPDLRIAVIGKKFTAIRDDLLRPLRNKIAHALVEEDDGSRLDDDEVFPYLPIAKLMAERLLAAEAFEQQTGAPMPTPVGSDTIGAATQSQKPTGVLSKPLSNVK